MEDAQGKFQNGDLDTRRIVTEDVLQQDEWTTSSASSTTGCKVLKIGSSGMIYGSPMSSSGLETAVDDDDDFNTI